MAIRHVWVNPAKTTPAAAAADLNEVYALILGDNPDAESEQSDSTTRIDNTLIDWIRKFNEEAERAVGPYKFLPSLLFIGRNIKPAQARRLTEVRAVVIDKVRVPKIKEYLANLSAELIRLADEFRTGQTEERDGHEVGPDADTRMFVNGEPEEISENEREEFVNAMRDTVDREIAEADHE